MTEGNFTSSYLWRTTLAARGGDDLMAREREKLRAAYLASRENATVLLGELARSMPDFTVHDITHVDALWETADLVCGRADILTPAEGYVLGCAFLLHDSAMGEAAYKADLPSVLGDETWRDLLSTVVMEETGNWPDPRDLAEPSDQVVARCRSLAIREAHASRAATLVDDPWTTSSGSHLYLLHDTLLRESYGQLIGDLAASHWWDIDTLLSRFGSVKDPYGPLGWQPENWTVDPLKLACILRLADAAQLDSRRAPVLLFALRGPRGEAWNHWRFQEHMSRPQLSDDRLVYSCPRPFDRKDAEAWWLALDYLRGVDREMKKVDALLYDTGRARLAARAVAYVDSPKRFAQRFPARGWRPVDSAFQVSDVPRLISTLGGEQLYGPEPEVAVRELIQNAHDAVEARRKVDPDYVGGQVEVRLSRDEDDAWILEVRDNGIGMDEDVLVGVLLDFGRTGWQTRTVRRKFAGLAGSGFQPKGRFGIGFYSVFMLGDRVEVLSRRYDTGYADARRMIFNGLARRPLVAALDEAERLGAGTTIRVVLANDPYGDGGLLKHISSGRFDDLVRRLVIDSSVPVVAVGVRNDTATQPPFHSAEAESPAIFDRLYPAYLFETHLRDDERHKLREEFERRATWLKDDSGRKVGLAVLGMDLFYWSGALTGGLVTVNGLRADDSQAFTGYLEGKPSRASRDNVEPVASLPAIGRWLDSQQNRLRELSLWTPSAQIELANTLYRGTGQLRDDHGIAMTRQGLLPVGGLQAWAESRNEVIICQMLPLHVVSRPPKVTHYLTGRDIVLPENWAIGVDHGDSFFDNLLPRRRDKTFEQHRYDQFWSWQKRWYYASELTTGILVRALCEAWRCGLQDLLAPVAARGWNDYADIASEDIHSVPVWILRRP